MTGEPMSTPQATPTSERHASTAVARVVDTAGHDAAATPDLIAGHLQAGRFFWVDLEGPSDDQLTEFAQSLQLPSSHAAGFVDLETRSSFGVVEDSVRAVLPGAADTKSAAWLEANYVAVVLTDRFLLTVHQAPCAPLQHARHRYQALDDGAARSDRALVLFLVLDVLIGSFRSQLLALDDRLGEIQLGMLNGAPPGVHDELIQILGVLTDGIQEMGWYSHDLEEIAENVERLPGMRPGAQSHFERHRNRIVRMRENGKDIREEAKDALGHYSQFVAGRQAQVINSLSIVATVFLPLSFLTGYFGMNFRVLTAHVQNTLWQFVLLGMLLPIASAAISLFLIHRLERRLGIRQMGRQPD
jgi:Mg2+ and Co2+ transporter CorA